MGTNVKGLTSKEVKELQYKYILNCIDGQDYFKKLTTDKDRVNFAMSCFESDYWNFNTNRNKQLVIADWFTCLPSCCTIAFENWEIISLCEKWGVLPENATEKQQDKILSNWFNVMAFRFMQLHAKLNK